MNVSKQIQEVPIQGRLLTTCHTSGHNELIHRQRIGEFNRLVFRQRIVDLWYTSSVGMRQAPMEVMQNV